MKKIISFLLSFVLLINYLPGCIVQATEINEPEEYSVKVLSSEIGLQEIKLIKVNNEYLMDLNCIISMTRTSRIDNANIIELYHGTRKIIINKDKQTLSESTMDVSKDIIVETINDIVYVSAYSLLTYLGATCSTEEGLIKITMPVYTLWEAIDFNLSNYTLDKHSLWGSDLEIKIQWISDTIMQIIFGVGLIDYNGKFTESILYEILDVNMFAYNGCLEENKKIESKIKENSGLMIDAAYNILYGETGEEKNKFSESMNLIGEYVGIYSKEFEKTRPSEFAKIDSELITDLFENINLGIDTCSLFFDIISRIYASLNYTDDTIKTMNYFVREATPDKTYYNKASEINKTLASQGDIIINTACEKIFRYFIENKFDEIIKELLPLSAKEFFFALDVGKLVTSLMPVNAEHIKASDADLKAMKLVEMQADVLQMITKKGELIEDGDKDIKLLESYKYLVSYWVRTTMAANEKLIVVAESSNGNKGMVEPLKKRNNKLSAILFKLSICQVNRIVWVEDSFFNNLPLTPVNKQTEISGGRFSHFMFYDDKTYSSISNTSFIDISEIVDGKVKEFYIKDDKIYYFKELDYGVLGLFSCNLDGTDKIQFTDNVHAFGTGIRIFINDTIYYENSQKTVGNFCKYDVVNKSLDELAEDEIPPVIFDDTYIYYCGLDGVYRCLLDYSQKEKISDEVQNIIGVDKYFIYTINEKNELQKSDKHKYSTFSLIGIPEKTKNKMFHNVYYVFADTLYMSVNNKVYKLINDNFEPLIELEFSGNITDFAIVGNKAIIQISQDCDYIYQYRIYEYDIANNTSKIVCEEEGPDPYPWGL